MRRNATAVTERKVTLKEVAQHSGVSPATASRVLTNSSYPVREDVREKVVASARKLGYSTIFLAQTHTQEIAVLVPTVSNPFYTSMISGVEGVMTKENYQVFLCDTHMCETNEMSERLLTTILSKGMQGLVVMSTNLYPLLMDKLEQFSQAGVKVVLADCPYPNNYFNNVSFDYEKGAAMGTEYLLHKGHRKIIYAGLRQERESRIQRVRGFYRTMVNSGLTIHDDQILTYEDSSAREDMQIEAGEALAEQIMRIPNRPTAVFAMNDMIAFGLLRRFHRLGVKVPEDISVLGFDDSAFCDMSFPGLTTVKVQSEQMGRMAAMLLLDELRGVSSSPVGLSVESCIIERGTVTDVT